VLNRLALWYKMAAGSGRVGSTKMPSAVHIGLGIGCLVIAVLMVTIGVWFSWSGFRDRDWSAVLLALLIIAVAVFATISAFNLFSFR